MAFDVGETLRISCQAFDATRALVDPDDLMLRVRNPDTGVVTAYALVDLTRTSVGAFHKDFVPGVAGSWFFRWEASYDGPPAVTVVEEGQVPVRASVVV